MNRARLDTPHEQPTPARPPVSIKGRGEGLRITVSGTDPAAVDRSLGEQLERGAGAFLADAAVTLEMPVGPLDLRLAERLAERIHAAGLRLTAVVAGGTPEARSRGDGAPARPAASPATGESAVVVPRTLRSGQRVTAATSVVVLGDVNAGAEVVAGGSVIVWGRLRGVVEAGLAEVVDGRPDAVICALDLCPTQLRIGAAIARAPEEPDRVPVPEIAREVDGHIVVEAWR